MSLHQATPTCPLCLSPLTRLTRGIEGGEGKVNVVLGRLVLAFPQRSPPRHLAAATCGGLGPRMIVLAANARTCGAKASVARALVGEQQRAERGGTLEQC